MEANLEIRHMMADGKFLDAEKAIDVKLRSPNSAERIDLLALLLQVLEKQNKLIPPQLLLDLSEEELKANPTADVEKYLQRIDPRDKLNFYSRIQLLRIQFHSASGHMETVYKLISDYQMTMIQKHVPVTPKLIADLSQKYFRGDFNLGLQRLVFLLMRGDTAESEAVVKELILSCVERSSPKGTIKKLDAIGDMLKILKQSNQLEIYRNYCQIYHGGIAEKKDYKRLVEMVIYFDDFKFQSLLLSLLDKLGLKEDAAAYSKIVKANRSYDFVYFDKYFSHLKNYFVSPNVRVVKEAPAEYASDLRIELAEALNQTLFSSEPSPERDDDETVYKNLLKHQGYTGAQLVDLAVSFLQAEMPRVALYAADLAAAAAQTTEASLKATYLQFTCLLGLGDYRRALDLTFQALEKAQTEDDILSFLYGQAEAYLRLGHREPARQVLRKILSIDDKYRLAKERLDKLNEI